MLSGGYIDRSAIPGDPCRVDNIRERFENDAMHDGHCVGDITGRDHRSNPLLPRHEGTCLSQPFVTRFTTSLHSLETFRRRDSQFSFSKRWVR